MSEPLVCFNKTGLIYQNIRYKWSEKEIPLTYPPIVQLYFMLYHAQFRWNTLVKQKLTWMSAEEASVAVAQANSMEELSNITGSVVATKMTQIALKQIFETMKKGLADLEEEKNTMESSLLCLVSLNGQIAHFLCVLGPVQIHQVFVCMAKYKDLFPVLVVPEKDLQNADVGDHAWRKNPFDPIPKLKFDHTTGKFE